VISGTIFEKTRTPLRCGSRPPGCSRQQGRGFGAEPVADLEFGSYQTAWAMFHRLRSVLVRPGRERLSDRVEVDETFIAEVEPGLRGACCAAQVLMM